MTTIGVVFVRHGARIKLIAILFAYRRTVQKLFMHQSLPLCYVGLRTRLRTKAVAANVEIAGERTVLASATPDAAIN